MNALWIASMVLQWIVIIVLSLVVLSLVRQFGEITGQAAPPEPRKDPFAPFNDLAEYIVPLVDGGVFRFGYGQPTPSLLIFLSRNCGACAQLPPAIRQLVKEYPTPEFNVLVVLKKTDRGEAKKYLAEHSLSSVPFAIDEDFPPDINPGGAPFAVAITQNGTVAARGRPKSLLHLLDMAQAAQSMAQMAPNHSLRVHEWGESAPYWDSEPVATNESKPRESAVAG